jgi:large subunit ribosomal protein L21
MIAIIELKGKQYRVEPGMVIRTMRVEGEVGAKITPERILAAYDDNSFKIGKPVVEGAEVELEVVRQTKSPKIHVFKYHSKKGYARRYGQRDEITYLRVTGIKA